MGAFLSGLKEEASSPVLWVAWVVISVAVSIAGPFGTYGVLSIFERGLFWVPLIAVAVVLAALVRAYVASRICAYYTLKGTLFTAVLNCLILVPFLYGVIGLILPETVFAQISWAEIAVMVASISLGICALRVSARADGPAGRGWAQQGENGASLPSGPRLLRRLDPTISGDIWAISVRDHYVDVQTSQGMGSILMRFSDAVAEVDCQDGAQVHRSHWVAWAAVGCVSREGGKVILHLKSGQQIPVSRNHRAKVDAQFPPPPVVRADGQRGAA